MEKIRAFVGYNDWTCKKYYTDFTICDSLPEKGYDYGSYREGDHKFVKEIKTVKLDAEQGSDKVYDYEYYVVTYDYISSDGEEDEEIEYIATLIEQ